LDMDSMKQKDR